MRELTETHQVLLFTCHPHVVEMAKGALPTTAVFSLWRLALGFLRLHCGSSGRDRFLPL